MKFRPKITPVKGRKAVFALAVAVAVFAPHMAMSKEKIAIVPTATIFPGEVISRGKLTEVPVTNPNIAPGYTEAMADVVGKVSKKTLIAGRTIPLGELRDPFAVERGANVRITYTKGGMNLSASGTAIEDAMSGEVVRVRNRDTGVTISGTAMKDGSVEVLEQ